MKIYERTKNLSYSSYSSITMRNFSCLNKKKKELCVFWRITKNKNKQPKRRNFGKTRALFAKGKLLSNKKGHKKRCLLYSARLHSLLMLKKLVEIGFFVVVEENPIHAVFFLVLCLFTLTFNTTNPPPACPSARKKLYFLY